MFVLKNCTIGMFVWTTVFQPRPLLFTQSHNPADIIQESSTVVGKEYRSCEVAKSNSFCAYIHKDTHISIKNILVPIWQCGVFFYRSGASVRSHPSGVKKSFLFFLSFFFFFFKSIVIIVDWKDCIPA